MSDTMVRTTAPFTPLSQVDWGPVIAGALTAAALASVLHAFAAALGLAVSSTAPTWRDASIALWILSGVYLVFVALVAYGVGGYVAGLLRERYGAAGTSSRVVGNSLAAFDGNTSGGRVYDPPSSRPFRPLARVASAGVANELRR